MRIILTLAIALLVADDVHAQQNRIDLVRHDAPELAYPGPYDIGVRTVEWMHADQVDVLKSSGLSEPARYDRKLVVEFWYPARLTAKQSPGEPYVSDTRNLSVTASLHGQAVRDAEPRRDLGAVPLIILSHGYPGNRYLMSHLAENLASKGYVVASIDHLESTYRDQNSVWSTLYHRPLDQRFVIDKTAYFSDINRHFLNGIVDTDQVGIVGYSMGGYGLLVNIGAGYSDATIALAEDLPASIAAMHAASSQTHHSSADPRIKAGLAIAPCCMNRGMWDADGLSRIETPLLLMAGNSDETAGYDSGVRKIYDLAVNSDRYLLTFLNAGHNAIAPIPLPLEIHESNDQAGAFHYTDAVWDSVKSSNVMTHFATAFFDLQLKADHGKADYLQLEPNAEDGVWALENDQSGDAHTYWLGFPNYSARGLVLDHDAPAH